MAARRGNAAMLTAARRILILAPHPDDEIVACGIAAARAGAAGAAVFVLYLTTGVPEAATLWPWQRADYRARVARRGAEALAAAALLGLAPVDFRDTPSRKLRFELDRVAGDIAAAIGETGAEALWVPAFEGGHQDHDAANAVAAAFADRLPVWEFAAYNFAGGGVRANEFCHVLGGDSVIAATPQEAALKRRALACYASERGNLRHLGFRCEACRPLPVHDYATPPHPGRLFRERFHWLPFRHPRVDFAPSEEIYRDLARWTSAGSPVPLSEAPGGKTGQPDRVFASALDQPERKRGIGR
jgi:LmbE family N-acetylglucosaminyl deacetylase